jgi:hypothetical protein
MNAAGAGAKAVALATRAARTIILDCEKKRNESQKMGEIFDTREAMISKQTLPSNFRSEHIHQHSPQRILHQLSFNVASNSVEFDTYGKHFN